MAKCIQLVAVLDDGTVVKVEGSTAGAYFSWFTKMACVSWLKGVGGLDYAWKKVT